MCAKTSKTPRVAALWRFLVSALLLGGVAVFAGCNDQAASNAFGPGGSPFLNGAGNLTNFITAPGGLSDALFGATVGTFNQTGFGTVPPNTIGGISGISGTSGIGGLSTIGGTGTTSGMGFTTTTTGFTNPGTISTGGLGAIATNNAFGTNNLTNTVPSTSFGTLSGVTGGGFSGLNTFTTLSGTSTLNSTNLGTAAGSPAGVVGLQSGF